MNTSLLAALRRFTAVPTRYARYEIDLEWASRIMAMHTGELASLAEEGLPHLDDPDRGLMFDYVDLINLGMFGGDTGQSVAELAARFMLRYAIADPASWYEPREWLVRVRPPAPFPSEGVTIAQPDPTAPGVRVLDAPDGPGVPKPGYQIAVRLTGAADTVRDPVAASIYADLLDGLNSGAVTYQAMPEVLRMRHREAWRLGMADCVVIARLLAERLRLAGFRARARRGYLLGLVGSDHAWAELYEDGAWKPLDAVFAHLAAEHIEFAEACAGGRFNRFLPCAVEEAAALVHVDGEAARPWVLAGVSSHSGRHDG